MGHNANGLKIWEEKGINFTCNAAPLQAEGEIDGTKYSYFRARWNSWCLSVGDSYKDAVEGGIFSVGGDYKKKTKDAASCMSKQDGAKFIKFGLDCYQKWGKFSY